MNTSRSQSPVVVVGAGLAGVTCARELSAAGLPVMLYDRGRRPGGRMSGRAPGSGEREADLGASYFTADDDFAAVADQWRERGLARPWTDTFTVLAAGAAPEDKSGPTRWGGTAGLRALVDDLAEPLSADGRWSRRTVETVAVGVDDALLLDRQPVAAVVLAMPDPQAVRLLGAGLEEVRDTLTREWEPALAFAAAYDQRTWDAVSPSGVFHGAFVNDHPTLAWIADDGRRRGDDAPVLVAHSTPDLARGHLDAPAEAGPALGDALSDLLGVGAPVESRVHRWTFAKPTGERDEPYLVTDAGDGLLGVCGDGWGPASKVQTAWRSGRDLGRALVERLG